VKLVFAILILSTSLTAQAAVQNLRVISGASKLIGEPATEVWGVMAGVPNNSQIAPFNAPYSNCEFSPPDDDFYGCHERRVNGSHRITVEFTETEEVNGAPSAFIKPQVATGTGGTNNIRIDVRDLGAVRSGTNQTSNVSFTWSRLCELIINEDGTKGVMQVTNDFNRCVLEGSDPAVPVSGTFIITFGFDSNSNVNDTTSAATLTFHLYSPPFEPKDGFSTAQLDCSNQAYGFCDIAVFPGDSGGTLNPPEGFPQTNKLVSGASASIEAEDAFQGPSRNINVQVERLRLYYSSVSYFNAHPSANAGNYSDHYININQSNGATVVFKDPQFDGLQNGTPYIFRGATVDSSGLVSYIMDANFCVDGDRSPNASEQCAKYSITPSEVAGLITESSCFITSATYGSPQASQVTLFRKFRAKYLWTNAFGRIISNIYNNYGPIGAKWIYHNPSSKKFVRAGLYPFYGFAFLSVHHGFWFASLIYLLGLALLALGFVKAFSKGKI